MVAGACCRGLYYCYTHVCSCNIRIQTKICKSRKNDLTKQTTLNIMNRRADMAQEVEHVLGKDEVTSSNLVISSIKDDGLCELSVVFAFFSMPENGARFFMYFHNKIP